MIQKWKARWKLQKAHKSLKIKTFQHSHFSGHELSNGILFQDEFYVVS